ncbi:MAG TPA: VWA domain-containing protein [Myxococcales bacterium LLY-WYZ-16_1]|nr:VWA domain-containing protein [Myxococcales bacterium LLY-WYZ-16_1]
MKPSCGRLRAGVLFGLSALGCTEVDLFRTEGLGQQPLDNKLAIRSRFCAADPTTLEFPTKILFVVDTSQSMIQTDPNGRRLLAVQEVVDAFIDDPGVSFGIVQYSGGTNVLTSNEDGLPGFSRDRMDIENAIVQLGLAQGTTDYEGALSQTLRVLSDDMANADEEDLTRSKYVVIFLSDGLPNPVDPPSNTRGSILELVNEIAELREVYRPAELRLHTALVLGAIGTAARCTDAQFEGGNPDCLGRPRRDVCEANPECVWVDSVADEAIDLLCAMSDAGDGTCRSFPNGEEINFLRIDFTSIRRVFALKNLVASNQNARPRLIFRSRSDLIGRAAADSDGDGLDDQEEEQFGTDILEMDTDDDGFQDFVEVLLAASGFDPLDPTDADCTEDLDRVDTDGDGLLDCEERFVGTNRLRPDSDADGFVDTNELLYGTNPATDDVRADLDFDAARNGDELRGHSDPAVNDAGRRGAISYRYEIEEKDLEDLNPEELAGIDLTALDDVSPRLIGLDPELLELDPLDPADRLELEMVLPVEVVDELALLSPEDRALLRDLPPRPRALLQGRPCYETRVSNITLAGTRGGGNNRVYLYAVQAPIDDPGDFGIVRIACVEQRFAPPDLRSPPFPEVEIPEDAFVPLEDFFPERDCTTGTPVF